ncbi:hypothetical protein Pmani_024062, partial [Petrolisthes manimaculis]
VCLYPVMRLGAGDTWGLLLLASCLGVNGWLVTVAGEEVQGVARDAAKSLGSNVWIGLSEKDSVGEWRWADGTQLNYTNWAHDQPQSVDGEGGVCVSWSGNEGEWMTALRLNTHHYLCQKHAEEEGEDTFYWTNGESLANHSFSYMTPEDTEAALVTNDSSCVFYQVSVWTTGVKLRSSWVPTDCLEARHFVCEVPVGQTLLPAPTEEWLYCSPGWLYSDGGCYLFMGQQVSWTIARTTCEGLGADLTSILTWTQQDFVHNNQMSSGWIGLQWEGDEGGAWGWCDHSTLSITNWAHGEDDAGGEDDAMCASIRSADGRWVSDSCSLPRTFTCRRPASDYPVAPMTPFSSNPSADGCGGGGWSEDPDTGLCYIPIHRDLPFQEARLYCQTQQQYQQSSVADLVSITSYREQVFLNDLMAGGSEMSRASVWVGLKGENGGVGGGAGWVDGSPLSYLNWAPGRPNTDLPIACVGLF